MYMCVDMHPHIEVRVHFQGSILSPCHEHSRDQIQIVRPYNKYLYPMHCITGPVFVFRENILPSSPNWPRTYYVEQSGL